MCLAARAAWLWQDGARARHRERNGSGVFEDRRARNSIGNERRK